MLFYVLIPSSRFHWGKRKLGVVRGGLVFCFFFVGSSFSKPSSFGCAYRRSVWGKLVFLFLSVRNYRVCKGRSSLCIAGSRKLLELKLCLFDFWGSRKRRYLLLTNSPETGAFSRTPLNVRVFFSCSPPWWQTTQRITKLKGVFWVFRHKLFESRSVIVMFKANLLNS